MITLFDLTISLATTALAASFAAALAAALATRRRGQHPDEPTAVAIVSREPAIFARTAIVYIAGCDGLKALRSLSNAEPRCWWKIGAVRADPDGVEDALNRRLESLGRCAYGGWIRHKDRMIEQPGFRSWRLQRLAVPDGVALRSDLSVGPDGITVRLPQDLSFGQFEARLRAALTDASWFALARRQRRGAGCRYSLRQESQGRKDGHAVATELFSLQPRRSADVRNLVAVITAILDVPR